MNQSQINLLLSFGIEFDQDDVLPQSPQSYEPEIPAIMECEDAYEYWSAYGPESEQHPLALEYADEVWLQANGTKIHRYSRTDRFKFTVYQLLGASGEVPRSVKKYIKKRLGKTTRKSKIWNQVRSILKEMKLRRYYNRIPQIIYSITKQPIEGINSLSIDTILSEFGLMNIQFDSTLRAKWKRSYFPNLRFIALKLFEKNGITYPYKVPLVRTLRKRKYLNSLYNEFNIC